MKIVILLYKGFTALDVVGAYEILCRLPGAEVTFVAKEKGNVVSEYASMQMVANSSLSDIKEADILLVPGSTFAFTQVAQDKELLQQIRRIDAGTKWTVSVCTGAVILGAAGLLADKKVTTHWAAMDSLKEFGARQSSERYVRDGKLVTAAGVSAGMDMALYLAGIIAGEEYARMLQLVTEYFPEPPFHTEQIPNVAMQVEEDARSFLKSEMLKMSRSEN